MTEYFVYDVFSADPFGGNQLAIIPDASQIAEADLQKIAREFNFSETTFVYPPKDSANTARVRIFTPTMEVPFAGHPVIGTACALHDEGAAEDIRLELGIGTLPCTANQGTVSFTTETALELIAEPDPALVAATLGLRTDDISFATHPPQLASLGLAFTITQLNTRDALSNVQTDVSAFREGREKHPSSLDFAQFVYTREADTIHARMFAPLDNIPEDPATGSACATLGSLLRHIGGTDVQLDIVQGEDMGRKSLISVSAHADRVTVSGQACRVMRGELVYKTNEN